MSVKTLYLIKILRDKLLLNRSDIFWEFVNLIE